MATAEKPWPTPMDFYRDSIGFVHLTLVGDNVTLCLQTADTLVKIPIDDGVDVVCSCYECNETSIILDIGD